MNYSQVKHLLTGDELNKNDIHSLLALASELKNDGSVYSQVLNGQHIALSFDKPSLRTRLSFTAAIHKLGANVLESVSQTRKNEDAEDFIRVIQGYSCAMMVRTFSDVILNDMAKVSSIPLINGLTDRFHPCQALADLLTLKENFKTLEGLKVAYIGDGNNVLHSLMVMANKLGIEIHYCCPEGHSPEPTVFEYLKNRDLIFNHDTPQGAVKNCNAVYTDVWTSMGFEASDEVAFEGYQVNESLMSLANDDAIFMHCMPMERGKEVSVSLPDSNCSVVFAQSENRMHVQQALLIKLLGLEK
jgi:ornithine carbamoyltransferase